MSDGAVRVLVAGATGYLGRHTALALAARGHRVRALTRRPELPTDLAAAVDDSAVADVTRPHTLRGACDGVDVVFSALTAGSRGTRFRDVDYQGNVELLAEARRAGVSRFVYVSVFGAEHLRGLEVVAAHEDFVDHLRASGMAHCIIRPNGFFSDLTELLVMARRGRVFVFGDGRSRMNPIDGRDLAEFCADHIPASVGEQPVGGPEVHSYREMAAIACRAAGRPVRISEVPGWVSGAAVRATRLFAGPKADVLAFVSSVTRRDLIAPGTGHRTLAAWYAELEAERRTTR